MRRNSFLVLVAFGLALMAAITVAEENSPVSGAGKKMKNPVPSSPQSVAAGQAVFAKNCGFCHGADAKGDGPMAPKDSHPPNLIDATWDHGSTDGDIFLVVRDGLGPDSKMKGVKGRIGDTDIWNVINYLRSLGPKK